MDLPNKRRRILVIEDHEDSAFMLKRLLEQNGFDVAIAATGELGLVAARQWSPHFVLLDIGLPGMDGYEVAAALQTEEKTAGLPIIAMSAFDPDLNPKREAAARFAVRFMKPVPVDRLIALFKSAV